MSKDPTPTCTARCYDGSPCGRDLYEGDDKHCIFHSSVGRKINEFLPKFQIEFERQKKKEKVYDFSGFIFPEKMNFSRKEFRKNTYFNGARFSGESTFFKGVKFRGEITSFDRTIFQAISTSFLLAEFFGKETSFINAKFFGEDTSFVQCKLNSKKTYFDRAVFSGKETSFTQAKFLSEETSFWSTDFKCQSSYFLQTTVSKRINLLAATFKNTVGLSQFLTKTKTFIFFKWKSYAVNDWRFYLCDDTAQRHPLIKRLVNDAWYLDEYKKRHSIVYFLWKISSNCGRSFLLWAFWSVLIATSFAFIFYYIYNSDPLLFKLDALKENPSFWSFFYYSVVTFTTLGFGDIVPAYEFVQRWVMAEVILGYIMLGGLISIFANKLARRS